MLNLSWFQFHTLIIVAQPSEDKDTITLQDNPNSHSLASISLMVFSEVKLPFTWTRPRLYDVSWVLAQTFKYRGPELELHSSVIMLNLVPPLRIFFSSTFSSDFLSSKNSLTAFETEDADFKCLKHVVKVCDILCPNYIIQITVPK